MRKVTQQTVMAFLNKQALKVGNTESTGTHLYLHGNKIAYWTEGGYIIIQTCGWNSNTTRERLNAIPNVRVYQRKGELYLNGAKWDGNAIAIDDNSKVRGEQY